MKISVTALVAILSLITVCAIAFDDPWPGAHNKRDNHVKETTENNTFSRGFVQNPELLREMMKRRETRQEIMQDKEVMKEMMQNKDLQREMTLYPEMRDQIMRDTDLRNMLQNGKKNETNKSHKQGGTQ